jgi:Tfp pilus assembly protein PilV
MFGQRSHPPSAFPPAHRRRRGLTLMETTLATVVVGLAVLATVKLVSATSMQTGYSQRLTTAFMLANNMRELLGSLPFNDPTTNTTPASPLPNGPQNGEASVSQYNDVQDFNNYKANPPIDANRQSISSLTNWQQSVSVQLVGDQFGSHINSGGSTLSVVERIKVTISFRDSPTSAWSPIVSSSWIKTKY